MTRRRRAGLRGSSTLRLASLVLLCVTGVGAFYEWGGAAYRGLRELREKRYREAAAAFRESRRDHPRSAAVRYDEALALQGAGSADSAAALYDETARSPDLEGNDGRSAAAYNRGNLAMRAKQYGAARENYRESLRLDPARVDAKKNLEEAIRRLREEQNAPPTGGSSGGGPPPPGGAPAGPDRALSPLLPAGKSRPGAAASRPARHDAPQPRRIDPEPRGGGALARGARGRAEGRAPAGAGKQRRGDPLA
jgi:tetratricopeptide (TPR) repeat protein